MSLTAIRAAAAAVLTSATDIALVAPAPPNQSPQITPMAYFGEATWTVEQGAVETWTYTLPLTVLVNRRGLIADELAATEPLIQQVVAAFRDNFTLGSTTFGFAMTTGNQGAIAFGQDSYFGFTAFFVAKEKFNVTLTG